MTIERGCRLWLYMNSRQKIPDSVATALLVGNDHACCICKTPRKHVQIHHIDGDPSNWNPANLAVLCLDCHSRVTGDEGLGRRYSEAEVKEYKRRWEVECSRNGDQSEEEDESIEEPVYTIYESRLIQNGEHYCREFEIEEGQEFVVSIIADDYIDVSICGLSDYRKWLKGDDLMEYDGDEKVRRCELSCVAPHDGMYVLLLTNYGREDVGATIDGAIWDGDGEE